MHRNFKVTGKKFRVIDLPPSDFKKNVRASTLASWFYCAEKFTHIANGLTPEEEIDEKKADILDTGTAIHAVLEESMGRRFPYEEEFIDLLKTYQHETLGFTRTIRDVNILCTISGHQDDLQITPDFSVSVIENKTIEIPKWPADGSVPNMYFVEKFKIPIAKYQSQIYSWILEPIVQKEGGYMHGYNAIQYWDRPTAKFVKWYPVRYDAAAVQEQILQALKACSDPSLVIRPKVGWKCKSCPEAHKKVCQFCKDGVPNSI